MRQIDLIGIFIAIMLIVGCSSQITKPQPNVSVGGLGVKHDIEISGFAFNPSTLTISKGTTVIWTNLDSVTHTVTSDTGNELHSGTLPRRETYAHTFDTIGTYQYHCTIHPTMKGTIIVE